MENTRKRKQTKAMLKDALIRLCEEKPYYDITIWDICNKAGTYRSTFYRYYDSKDEMLHEIEHEYLEDTRNLTKSFGEFRPDAPTEKMKIFLDELTRDMEYHRQNSKLCRFLLSPAGDLYFHQKMISSIGTTIRENYRKQGITINHETEYLINFFAAGFISTISNWLEKSDRTSKQTAEFLLNMMLKLKWTS